MKTKIDCKKEAEVIMKLKEIPSDSLLYKMAKNAIERKGFYSFKRLTDRKVTGIHNGIDVVKYTEVKTFVEA